MIDSPQDQVITDIATIIVSGRVDPEIKVEVNSQEIPVEQDGAFKEEVSLSSPVNKITITAISKFGQKTEIERTVYLKE